MTAGAPEQWSGDRVARWLRQSAGLERQLAPVSSVLFEAARLAPGEAVLDVGCGTGPTTWAAARLVGATGRVTGLDVSPEMLAAAEAGAPTAEADALAPVDWVAADAVTWEPTPPGAYDVVLSRFGVMFFSDPARAFGHLADSARSGGGRLAIAVWRRRDESDLFAVPLAAALTALPHLAADAPPDDEGPFSLGDPHALTELLRASGWDDIIVAEHRLPLPFAGGVDRTAAARAALDFGTTRTLLAGRAPEEVAAAEAAIAAAFEDHLDGDGHVVLTGAVQVVTARRS